MFFSHIITKKTFKTLSAVGMGGVARNLSAILILSLCLFLASCGGGGDGAGAPPPPQSAAVEEAPPAIPAIAPSLPAGVFSAKEAREGLSVSFSPTIDPGAKIFITQGSGDIAAPQATPEFSYTGQPIVINNSTIFKFLIVASDGRQFESTLVYAFDTIPPASPAVRLSANNGFYNSQLQVVIEDQSQENAALFFAFGEGTFTGIEAKKDLNQLVAEGRVKAVPQALLLACPEGGFLEGQPGTLQAIAVDAAGNVSQPQTSAPFTCDKTAPKVDFRAALNGRYTEPQVINLAADEPVTLFFATTHVDELASGGANVQQVEKGANELFETILNQPHSHFRAKARDRAGNESEVFSREYVIEITPFVEVGFDPIRRVLEADETFRSIIFKRNLSDIEIQAAIDRDPSCVAPSAQDEVLFDAGLNESRNILGFPLGGAAGETHRLRYCFIFREGNQVLFQSPILEETVTFVGISELTVPKSSFVLDTLVEEVPQISLTARSPAEIESLFFTLDNNPAEKKIELPSQNTVNFETKIPFPPEAASLLTLTLRSKSGKELKKEIRKRVEESRRHIQVIAGSMDISLGFFKSVATDAAGNVFIVEGDKHRIRKVFLDGTIRTVAGTGSPGFSGDGGLATNAQLHFPEAVAVDGAGNVFIADVSNDRIRKVSPDGIITTVAGSGGGSFVGEGGLATAASMHHLFGVAADAAGNFFIVDSKNQAPADADNNRIRKIDTNGIITTVTGSFAAGFSGDGGLAKIAKVNFPKGVAVDPAGNVFIADTNNHRIRKVDTNGIITTFAGAGVSGFSGDGGLATAAALRFPHGVFVDPAGNVFIADTNNHRIRKVDTNGIITTVAGSGVRGFSGDRGPATAAALQFPRGVFVDPAGNLFIADTDNLRIRKVDTNGIITTFAGRNATGFSGDGGAATNAQLNFSTSVAAGGFHSEVAVDGAGNVFIADTGNSRIRKVSPDGIITTVAGTGSPGFSGDGGLATNAQIISPFGVAVDGAGNVFIADTGNSKIRKVSPDGIITTVAGTGGAGVTGSGFSGDGGAATGARLDGPASVAVDGAGNVFIADTRNSRIRKVDTNGIITTFAGAGVSGFSGDGGPATAAALNFPGGVFADGAGNLFIGDTFNNRIRKVDTNGIITAFAGAGVSGFSGDGGPATAAALNFPGGVFADGAGNLFIADSGNAKIRRVSAKDGTISTINEYTGIGLSPPVGIAIHGSSIFVTSPHGVVKNSVVP